MRPNERNWQRYVGGKTGWVLSLECLMKPCLSTDTKHHATVHATGIMNRERQKPLIHHRFDLILHKTRLISQPSIHLLIHCTLCLFTGACSAVLFIVLLALAPFATLAYFLVVVACGEDTHTTTKLAKVHLTIMVFVQHLHGFLNVTCTYFVLENTLM